MSELPENLNKEGDGGSPDVACSAIEMVGKRVQLKASYAVKSSRMAKNIGLAKSLSRANRNAVTVQWDGHATTNSIHWSLLEIIQQNKELDHP